MDLPDSDRGDFSCRRAVDSSSSIYYYKRMALMLMSLFEGVVESPISATVSNVSGDRGNPHYAAELDKGSMTLEA